jgi:hypothetical protein
MKIFIKKLELKAPYVKFGYLFVFFYLLLYAENKYINLLINVTNGRESTVNR